MNMSSIKVNCSRDDNDYFYSGYLDICNGVIDVDYDNLYVFNDIGYFGEDIYKYYVICPRCGNINFIDDSILSSDIMSAAREKSDRDIYIHKKNVLRSQFINLEYKREKECKKRVLK